MELLRYIADKFSSFVGNESGLVQPQKSLSLAWGAGILAGAAMVLGAPQATHADPQYCTGEYDCRGRPLCPGSGATCEDCCANHNPNSYCAPDQQCYYWPLVCMCD